MCTTGCYDSGCMGKNQGIFTPNESESEKDLKKHAKKFKKQATSTK